MRLLILDDDEAIGRLIVRVATMSGLGAVAVADAPSFRRQLQGLPPDAIMLDLQLSETDGVEQMRMLAQERYSGTLILMSGYDSRVLGTACELARTLGLKVGRIVEKPLHIADLEHLFATLQSTSKTLSPERLREAIANDEISLDFQPIVSRRPKTLHKLEALVRWDHPVAGRLQPDDFLTIAESDPATIAALTDWTVGAAVAAYRVLEELGVPVKLAVNISLQTLQDLSLPNRLVQCLRDGGMPPEKLCLEITESAAFKNTAHSMDILSRIRLKGIQLSIDNFGSGYSSLTMLRQMPFTEIKIDRSFGIGLATSRDCRTIAKCIIDLAANMGLHCVAPGIESEETASLLEAMGACDLQGSIIADAMPVEAVPAWLDMWQRSEPLSPSAFGHDSKSRQPAPPVPLADATPKATPSVNLRDACRLPPQQLAVMKLLAEGCSVKEIARRLGLGIGTVKVHLSLAYSALGAHNRIEAVMRFLPLQEREPAAQPGKVMA